MLISLPLLIVAVRTGVFGTALCNALMIASVLLVVACPPPRLPARAAAARDGMALEDMWLLACISAVGPLLVAFMGDQRDRARAQAMRAGERVRVLTDALPAFVAEIGADLRYRFVNAKYQAVYGLPPKPSSASVRGTSSAKARGAQVGPHLERALEGHPSAST